MKKNFSRKTAYISEKKIKERDYWINKLSGDLVKVCFPLDKRKKTGDAGERFFETVGFPPGDEIFTRLMKLRNQSDHILHMILAAATVVLLHKYSWEKHRDIIVGAPIYKQDIQGEFINTVLPLRVQLPEGITFKELLLQVRQTMMEAVEHQNYPLESLLYHLNIPFSKDEDFPLFDVVILLENIHDKAYLQHIRFNMNFSFSREDESIAGVLEFNAHAYERGTIKRIQEHFIHVLRQCLENIDAAVEKVELLWEKEREQLLWEFNAAQIPFDEKEILGMLFEKQVEKTPDQVALMGQIPNSESQIPGKEAPLGHLSYGKLNEKSNQLAHFLRGKGARPDTMVAIMVERDIDTVIGIIAVLKAGAGYLPIDPETPLTRNASILEESAASLVLAKNISLDKFAFSTLQGLRRTGIKPVFTAPRPPISDLDRLPFPDRSLIDYSKYNRYIGQAAAKNIIVIQASRGCPYHCAYCHKIWPKKQVFRSPGHIFSEIELNYRMGMRKFAFVDDIFNLNRETGMKLFQMVIDQGLDVQFYFPNGLRGDILTKEYIDLMVEAGTVSLALALETGSPRLQKLIRKNLHLEKFRENIQYISEKYPQVILELFTMYGFPSETEEEALMTLDFIKSIKWIHFPYINVLKIYPHTDMEQLALNHGITRESILRSENFAHFEISDNCPLDKKFTLNYRSDFLQNYFLSKERLLHVLLHQLKLLTRDEILQKYNSYLPTEIHNFDALLTHLDIEPGELEPGISLKEDITSDFHLKWQQRARQLSAGTAPPTNPLRILLLDLSQFFSKESDFFYDVMGEAPLGMMYLLTYLNHRFGNKIIGKIAKSRIDFDSYRELKALLTEFKPDVIGVRSLSIYKNFFHKIISLIRQWGIDVPVIAGGPYPSSDITTVLQDPQVDLVVPGEGEITFSEVIETIMKNSGQLPPQEELKKIPGIAFIPRWTTPGKTVPNPGTRDVIMPDVLETTLSKESTQNPHQVNRPTDIAYTIFTSGSTGNPKGVMIQHRNVHYLVQALKEKIYKHYRPDAYLKISMVSPFIFDASIKQIFGALMQGHGLYIVKESVRVDAVRLFEFYREQCIDIADGTPAHITMLTEAIKGSTCRHFTGNFLIGGEPLTQQVIENFFSTFTTAEDTPKITNVYGSTECSVDSTTYEVSRENIHRFTHIPIGTPMPNCQVYILDNELNLLPVGVPGELCISGAGVGRGYLNDQQLTAEKFDRDLWDYLDYRDERQKVPGKRVNMSYTSYRSYIYKTGDLARWLPCGNIIFIGRKDQQVKIRGFRIEPGEIEKRLVQHKSIKEAVVMVRGNTGSDKYLCAYVVYVKGNPGEAPDFHELKEYLSRELPGYMIPTRFIQVEKIPLTPNGKIHRQALPEPGTGSSSSYIAPADSMEEKVAELFAGVLGINKDKISINDNFFESGGHSLKATILLARMHKVLGIKVPLSELFRFPTVRELSGYIKNAARKQFDSIPKAKIQPYYPLTSAVKRLYFEQQMDPQGTIYNIFSAVECTGQLDRQKLENIFKQIIRRQESLRTSFHLVDYEPMMKIHDEVEFEIEYFPMKEVEVKEGDPGLAPLFIKSFIRPFDLSRAPLLRVGLIGSGPINHILMVNVHHMAADGTSIGLMIKEFMMLYQGKELPPLKIQYKDFSLWKDEIHNDKKHIELLERQKKYWLDQFKGEIPLLELPYDFPRPQVKSTKGAVLRINIGVEETRHIKKIALKKDATLFMVMLTVFNIFLAKLSGQEDIVVGTPLAGRPHTDLEPIIGMFVNTLAIRNYPTGEKRVSDFLKEVKAQSLKTFENQDYRFEELVREVVSSKDLSRNPLFDVFFALQNMEMPAIDLPGLKLKTLPYDSNMSRFDIGVHIYEIDNRLLILVEYCTMLFKEETIKLFLKNFREIIAAVLENPDTCLQDIKISTEASAAKPKAPSMELGF